MEGELHAYLRGLSRDTAAWGGRPDLLLVLADSNGRGESKRREELESLIPPDLGLEVAVACPTPHVEAWCFADPIAFQDLLRIPCPQVDLGFEKDRFKKLLVECLEKAGETLLGDPMNIALELVPKMDFYRAAKSDPSLGRLITLLRARFKRAP